MNIKIAKKISNIQKNRLIYKNKITQKQGKEIS